MKRINSLSDLLMEEMAHLLNAESLLIEVLPKLVKASKSLALNRILTNHLDITKEQVHRLDDIFNKTAQVPQKVTSKVMKGLVQEGEDIVNNTVNGQARDLAIISMMQRVEQYEILVYLTATEHAGKLGHSRIVELLDKTLNEERAMHLLLSELAQSMINVQASGSFSVTDRKFNRGGIKKKKTEGFRFINKRNLNIQEDKGKSEKGDEVV